MKKFKKLILSLSAVFLMGNAFAEIAISNLQDVFEHITPATLDTADVKDFCDDSKKSYADIENAIKNTVFTAEDGNNAIAQLFALCDYYNSFDSWGWGKEISFPAMKYLTVMYNTFRHSSVIKGLETESFASRKVLEAGHNIILKFENEVGNKDSIIEAIKTTYRNFTNPLEKQNFVSTAIKLKKFYSMILGTIILERPKALIEGLTNYIRHKPSRAGILFVQRGLKFLTCRMFVSPLISPFIWLIPFIGNSFIGDQMTGGLSSLLTSKVFGKLEIPIKPVSRIVKNVSNWVDRKFFHSEAATSPDALLGLGTLI